ncbi:MAG: 30S ribosomal protein S6 [Elusimicrobiota bacterium]|jgi:small subunit ribosomal protein S6|nr:30S ribosomal protein S6 [Elusimicrobiota bacterium]
MNYESTFVCSPDLPAKQVEELTEKVKKIIETTNGSVKTVQQLGRKKLAYTIKKFNEGSYVYMEISGNGEMVNAIETFFKLTDDIIRYLTVKVEKKKKQVKAANTPVSPEKAAPQKTEVDNESTEQLPLA